MALDSAAKRAAVPGVGRPWMRSIVPDAAAGSAWRATVANVYPVADFAGPVDNEIARSIEPRAWLFDELFNK